MCSLSGRHFVSISERKCLARSLYLFELVKMLFPRPRPFPPSLSRRCRSRTKCLIEFQTRQLHRSVIGLSDAADTVLKETDKNSESFTVHRSPAQARFDPTPAAASARRQRLRILMPRESERPENEISVPADQRARYGKDPNCRGIQTKEERNPKLRYVSAIALIPELSGN